jgi:hypothetical protein
VPLTGLAISCFRVLQACTMSECEAKAKQLAELILTGRHACRCSTSLDKQSHRFMPATQANSEDHQAVTSHPFASRRRSAC